MLDFATYARFFLAVLLLFIAEVVVGPRLRTAGLHFVQANFVRPEDLPTVEAAIVRVRRRREALLPERVMLGIALFGAWYLPPEAEGRDRLATGRALVPFRRRTDLAVLYVPVALASAIPCLAEGV